MDFRVTCTTDVRGQRRFRVVDRAGVGQTAVNDFLDSLLLRNYSVHTVRNYAHDLACFFHFLQLGLSDAEGHPVPTSPALVRMRHVETYVAWLRGTYEPVCSDTLCESITPPRVRRPLAASTVNRHLAALKSFYARQLEVGTGTPAHNPVPDGRRCRGWLQAPPAGLLAHERRSPGSKHPVRLRTARRLPPVMSDAQVRTFLQGLRTDRDRAIMLLMVEGGARASEALGVTFEDLDPPFRTVRLRGKGRKERTLEVHPLFFDLLQRYLLHERPARAATGRVFVALRGPTRGRPLTYQGLRTVFDGNRRRTGLAHVTLHVLRHTCATTLAGAGMKLLVLQAFLGHEDPRSTSRYVHVSEQDLHAAYQAALERRGRRRGEA